MKEVYEVYEVVVMILGYILAGAMLIRSFTLVVETPPFFHVMRREYSLAGASWVTFRYMILPALLASPGWIVISEMAVFYPTPEGELEAMAMEVIEMLEEE